MPSSSSAAPRLSQSESGPDNHAVDQQSTSALKAARRNLQYLYDPKNSPNPARFRTRALLRSIRYLVIFAFWRVVRWAKYVAIGSLVATVLAGPFGWLAAPTTVGLSLLSGAIWQAGKFGARRLNKRWRKEGGDAAVEAREMGSPLKTGGAYGQETGPQAMPW